MNHLYTWFKMNGYCFYIWTAYGVVGLVLIGNYLQIKWQKKRTKHRLVQWFKGLDL
ncbi:MAG: heme exporter protein CcmD [Legionella sp.]|nr:heme exporter protein CcmD [Legionella sp.]